MKRIFSSSLRQATFLLMVIAAVAISSCSKGDYPKNLTIIPKESSLVASFDIEKLAKKADIKELKKSATFTSLSKEILPNQPTFKAILDDPSKSGVAFKQVFVFLLNKNNVGITFALNDASAFEKMVQEVAKGENQKITIQSAGDYKYVVLSSTDDGIIKEVDTLVTINQNKILIWDKDKALFLSNTPKDAALKLFGTAKDASIVTDKDFKDFYSDKKEIALWMKNEAIYGSLSELSQNPIMKAQGDLMKDTYSHYNIEFNEGEVAMTTQVTPLKAAKKIAEQYTKAKPDNAMLKYFPGKSFMLGKWAVNVPEIVKLFTKDKQVAAQLTPENQKIINSLEGDFVFSLIDFADAGMPMPQAAIAATVKDKTIYDLLVNQAFGSSTKRDCGGYMAVSIQVYTVFIAQKGNILMVANKEDVVKSFVAGKPLDNNLTKSSLKGVEDTPGYFYLNLDIDTYPSSLIGLLDNFGAGAGTKFKESMFFKDLEGKYDAGKCTSSAVLRLKDTKGNSLAVILKKIDAIAGK